MCSGHDIMAAPSCRTHLPRGMTRACRAISTHQYALLHKRGSLRINATDQWRRASAGMRSAGMLATWRLVADNWHKRGKASARCQQRPSVPATDVRNNKQSLMTTTRRLRCNAACKVCMLPTHVQVDYSARHRFRSAASCACCTACALQERVRSQLAELELAGGLGSLRPSTAWISLNACLPC